MSAAAEQVGEVIEQVDVDGFDLSCQTRAALDESAIADYAEALQSGAELPPAEAFRDGDGRLYLSSGFHRRLAYERAGRRTMPVVVRSGGRWEALANGMRANAQHGVRLTREDRRHNVELTLRERPDMSDRAVAELAGVSPTSVGKVRSTIQSGQSAVRVGRDGRAISTTQIGEWRREGGPTVNGLQSTSVSDPSEGAKETAAEGEKRQVTSEIPESTAGDGVVELSVPQSGPVSVTVEPGPFSDLPADLRDWAAGLKPEELAALRRFIRLRRQAGEPEAGLGWRAVVDARRALGGFSVKPPVPDVTPAVPSEPSGGPESSSESLAVDEGGEVTRAAEGPQDEPPGVAAGALPDVAKGRECVKRGFEFIGRAKKALGDLNTQFPSERSKPAVRSLDEAARLLAEWRREELEGGGF